MKRFLILALCIAVQAQAANILDAVLFNTEETTEQTTSACTRDCKKCSKAKCGGCTRR